MSNTWSGHFKTAREQLCLNCYLFTEITHMMKGKKIYKDIVPVSAMVLKSLTGSKSQSCWNILEFKYSNKSSVYIQKNIVVWLPMRQLFTRDQRQSLQL